MVEQRVLVKVADWYRTKGANKRIYYMYPYFAYKADTGPFKEKGFDIV